MSRRARQRAQARPWSNLLDHPTADDDGPDLDELLMQIMQGDDYQQHQQQPEHQEQPR